MSKRSTSRKAPGGRKEEAALRARIEAAQADLRARQTRLFGVIHRLVKVLDEMDT